jgi:hypothetical protein
MRSVLLTFFSCAFVVWPSTVHAQKNMTDGNYLLGSCQITVRVTDDPKVKLDVYEALRDGYCRGIVEGVTDVSLIVCASADVTFGQEIRVIVKFLNDHPEKLHLRNTKLVQEALAQAFPCSKQ